MNPPNHPVEFDEKKADFESALKNFNEFLRTLDPEWRRAILSKVYKELGQKLFEFHMAAELAITANHLGDCTDPLRKQRIHAAFKVETSRLDTLYKRRK